MKKVKHFWNLARYLGGATEPGYGPFKVQWEITYQCNLRCRHCHIWQVPREIKVLPLEREKEIIQELASAGVLNLSFSGGEMFLRRDVFELIKTAKDAGLYVAANSNGWLINEEMAQKIADSGLDQIYLSLDGPNAEIHDNIRGVAGAFEHVILAIKNLKKFQKKGRPKIMVNFVINRQNWRFLTATGELLESLGVDGLTVEPVHFIEKYSPEAEVMLTVEDWPGLKDEIKKFVSRFSHKLPHLIDYFKKFEVFVKDKEALKKIRCLAGYGSLQIHPTGDVYPCPAAFFKMGNLGEQSFGEIWQGEPGQRVRKLIKAGQHPVCWFTCVAPMNLFLSYFNWRNFYKLFNPKFIRYLWEKSRF